jgi:hypothetical protein
VNMKREVAATMDHGEPIVGTQGMAMGPLSRRFLTFLMGVNTCFGDLEREIAASMNQQERAVGVEAMGKRQLYHYNFSSLSGVNV